MLGGEGKRMSEKRQTEMSGMSQENSFQQVFGPFP